MIKKEKLSKEEKQAIKEFKASEKHAKIKPNKVTIRKEHMMLLIAIIVLIAMVVGLLYVLFFSKKQEVIVPDLPQHENVDIGVVDFQDEASDSTNLNTKKVDSLDVNYTVISDYYKEGILLSNTQVDYVNSSFLVTSGNLSKEPFVSTISIEGKLNWLTKLKDKNYSNIYIYETIFLNDNYYAFTIAQKGNKNDLVVFMLDKTGKIVTSRIIDEDITGKIVDIVTVDNKIGIISNDNNNINAYFTDVDLKTNNLLFDLNKTNSDLSSSIYLSSIYNDNQIQMVIKKQSDYYLVTIADSNASANIVALDSINNLNTTLNVNVSDYLKGFVLYTNEAVYKLDPYNALINKMDYSTIKLEDDTAYKEKYKDDEFIDVSETVNEIFLNNVKVEEGKIVVKANTLYSSIYDIYDSNLKISKRYILDTFKYSYDDGVILDSFYIDGAIYEVYSYGTKTPSIMISKIG